MKLKQLFFITYLIILLINVFGILVSEIVNRQYFMFLHIPILLAMYLTASKTKNYKFILALAVISIGVYYFNFSNKNIETRGLLCYTIAIIIYVHNVLKNSPLFSLSKVVFFIPITMILFVIGSYSLLISIEGVLFYNVIIYAIVIAAFLYFSLLNFTTVKTKTSRFLFLSAVLLICSSLLSGYNLFINDIYIMAIVEFLSFSLAHLFMTLYMIDHSKIPQLRPEFS